MSATDKFLEKLGQQHRNYALLVSSGLPQEQAKAIAFEDKLPEQMIRLQGEMFDQFIRIAFQTGVLFKERQINGMAAIELDEATENCVKVINSMIIK